MISFLRAIYFLSFLYTIFVKTFSCFVSLMTCCTLCGLPRPAKFLILSFEGFCSCSFMHAFELYRRLDVPGFWAALNLVLMSSIFCFSNVCAGRVHPCNAFSIMALVLLWSHLYCLSVCLAPVLCHFWPWGHSQKLCHFLMCPLALIVEWASMMKLCGLVC